jgi:catechol 2,3-dioxygenase-like lactoylglutathione lyase family enzyme
VADDDRLIEGVDFLSVSTRDLAAATAFYEDVLGLRCSARYRGGSGVEFETGNLTLSVMDYTAIGRENAVRRQPLALHVADVAAARARGDKAEISHSSYLSKRAGMRLNMAKNYGGKPTTTIAMQGIRIGPLAMVSMPGEPFCEIGAGVRQRSPFAVTMVSGYSNGQFSYIPMKADYELGGYGVWNSPLAPGAGEKVIDEACAVLEDLA